MSTAPHPNSTAMNLHVSGDLPATSVPLPSEKQIAKIREELHRWNGDSESRLEDVSDAAWLSSLEIAREMFGGHPKLELTVDPSEPSFPFVVVEVLRDPRVELKAWLAKESSWYERVHSLYSGPFNYPRLIAYLPPK